MAASWVKYIHPSITIRDTDRELKLGKTGGYGSPSSPQLILSEPWSKNELKFVPKMNSDDLLNPITNYNGEEWYFTMKIRRNELSQIMDDSTVLSIKLPFSAFKKDITAQGKDTVIRTNGYIKFDSIPNDNYYSYYKEFDTIRGVYRGTQTGGNTTELLIKRKHILKTTDSSITISTKFICNDFDNDTNNFFVNYFHNNPPQFIYFIDSIGIEVKYHGRLNVAIDFLKFENPNAQKLNRGGFDGKITTAVQSALNIFSDTSFTNRGIRPMRFYTRDEGGLSFWGATRYFNKLVGNLGTFEGGPLFSSHFFHYVNPPERWLCPWSFSVSPPVFFINHSTGMEGNVNYLGYKYSYNYNYFGDSLNSGCETFLYPSSLSLNDLKNSSDEDYLSKMYGFSSTQSAIEKVLYINYVNKLNNKFLYNNLNWWSQFQILTEWELHKINNSWNITLSGSRSYTGEEIRYGVFNGICMGAKGLSYDGEYSADIDAVLQYYLDRNPDITEISRIMTRIGHGQNYYDSMNYNNIDNDIFLNKDDIGSDFLNETGDSTNMNLFIDFDVVCDSFQINHDRLYLGRKSIRKEMKKIHDWVKYNQNELLNIKLAAWYGIGYKEFYNQDPIFISDTVLKKYIDINKIRTKKFFDVTFDGGYTEQETFENIDSSFMDITLHRLKSDTTFDNSNTIYIGLQNRRLSPLIYFTEDSSDKHILFLSTAEYEELCDSGGINPLRPGTIYPDTIWQKYKYKSLGSREITIPFNYCDSTNPNDYVLLHVKELKADNAYDSTWSWWRKERYANYIDTVIGQNSSLAVKFQPGEGKLFSCQILKPKPIQGNLAQSNQSKFVVFPDENDSTKVRYHLTYHKPDTLRNGVMSVFYSRSVPMKRNSDSSQIIWEPEICISPNIRLKYLAGNPPLEKDTIIYNAPAQYPSIVVRKDPSGTNAYIVYQTIVQALDPTCEDTTCFPDVDNCKYILNPICEKILNVGRQSMLPPPNHPTILDSVVYGNHTFFGTPVINASKNGNFIAWADEHCGISVGYKEIGSSNFVRTYDIKANNGIASNPSINIYSIFDKNENDCSIVWQEKDSGSTFSSIYYTKLKFGIGGLEQFLPPSILNFNPSDRFGDCLKLSDLSSSYLPTVYRLPTTSGSDSIYRHYEVIAWHTAPEDAIVIKTLTFSYNYNHPDPFLILWFKGTKKIHSQALSGGYQTSTQHCFRNPVLSQVSSYIFSGDAQTSDNFLSREFLLNFSDSWHITGMESGSKIYHLREDMTPSNYYIQGGIVQVKEFNKNIYPVAEGTFPHLAYSQNNNTETDVWKNHRVYSYGTLAGYSKIVPNPIYFHPIVECPQCKKAKKYYGSTNLLMGGGFSMPLVALNGEPTPIPLAIHLPYIPMTDSIGDYLYPTGSDTIYTDWFMVDSTAELQYLVKLNDTTRVQFKLQKLSDSSFVDLPAPYLPNTGFARQVFYLVNGNYDEYRLAMVNTDTLLSYSEDLYFEEPTVIDTIYAKRSYEVKKNVVNLNKNISLNKQFNLQCMPNPANEVLKVAVYSNQNVKAESVNIQIYNYQGKVVWESNSIPNSTSTIPVSGFENGIYLVRANILTENGYITETSKVVILR